MQSANERCNELYNLGMEFQPRLVSYIFQDVNISMVEIKTLSDQEWKELISKVTTVLNQRKQGKNND